jgi:hypothetical protein
MYLYQLRSLKPEAGNSGFGHCVTGVCKEGTEKERISSSPIHDEDDFLFTGSIGTKMRMLHTSMGDEHKILFSHVRLHASNIVVTSGEECNGCYDHASLSTVFNWDRAGLYPEYWDYVQAMHRTQNVVPQVDWADYCLICVGKYMGQYAKDLLRVRRVV